MRFAGAVICIVAAVVCAVPAAAESLDDAVGEAIRAREFERAEAMVSERIASQPNDAEAYRLLSITYLVQGRWDDVIEAGRRAVELSPDDPDMHMALAAGYREKARRGGMLGAMKNAGKWRDGIDRALELDPGHLGARRWLVLFLANAPGIGGGDKDQALEVARETLQYDEYRGRMLMGYANRKRGEYEEGIAEFTKAMEAAPDSTEPCIETGYCHQGAGRYDEAQRWFLRYLELAPGDPIAYLAYGNWYREQNRDDEALAQFARGVEIDPYSWRVRWEYANLLEQLGRRTDAIKQLELLIELTPNAMTVDKAKKRLRRLTGRR